MMLGRTHMAIGALAGVAITPSLLHTHLPILPTLTHVNLLSGIPNWVTNDALFVAASVLGSTVPDFDQRNSLLARKAEKLVQLITFVAILAGILMLHLQSSPIAWACGLVTCLITVLEANLMRRIAIGLLAAGLLVMGVRGIVPMAGSVCLVAWCVGAMWTSHRTFTHGLLGLALFTAGLFTIITEPRFAVLAWGAVLGYAMHIAADIPAGGVPLLWPWRVRQGGSLVRTGGPIDHLIGIAAIVGVVALVI